MNVRMMPPQGPMGQPMPMGGSPAPMPPMGPPQGGPMPMPPMQSQPTAGQQKGQGLGSTFGGSVQGRQGFKQFMAAKKQTSALVPQMPVAQMPMPMMSQMPQPMLPAPNPQMLGAMKPMGAPQMGGPVQVGRPMRGSQGGLGSAPVQLNMGGVVPQLSMDMAANGPAVYLGDQRLSDPADFHQKMLRAGYGRDAILDSASNIRDAAMHIVEDTDEYLGGARSGFGYVHEFNEGGEVPRETVIAGQPHYLAYINPEEGELLKGLGGAEAPGPGGIPSYWLHTSEARSSWGGGSTTTSSNDNNNQRSEADVQADINKALKDSGGQWTSELNDLVAEREVARSGGGGTTATNTSTTTTTAASSNDNDRSNIGSSGYVSLDAIANEAVQSDPNTNFSHMGVTYDNVFDYHDAIFGDDDDDPVVTTTQPVSTGTLIDLSGADLDLDAFGGAGADVDTGSDPVATSSYYEPPGFDFDGDGVYGEGSGVLDNNDDNPFVDVDPDPVTPIYDSSDNTYDGGSSETDFTQPVVAPVVDTTPAPAPAPPPVYYDMFGDEYDTQEAADAADAAYTAASNAVNIASSTPKLTGSDVLLNDVDYYTQDQIDASNNIAKLSDNYTKLSDDYSNFQGFDLTKGDANTIGYSTGGPRAGYAAIINMYTGNVDILAPGSQETGITFSADNVQDAIDYITGVSDYIPPDEDAYGIGLEGEFGGLDLDIPDPAEEISVDVGLEAAVTSPRSEDNPQQFNYQGDNFKYGADEDITYSNWATKSAKPFENIVFHHTGNNYSAENQVKYGQTYDEDRGGRFGYHFVVDKDGQIIQGAPLDARTNHLLSRDLKDEFKDVTSANSIGISLVGAGDDDFTQVQIDAAKELAEQLRNGFGTITGVYGQGAIQSGKVATEGVQLANLMNASESEADSAIDTAINTSVGDLYGVGDMGEFGGVDIEEPVTTEIDDIQQMIEQLENIPDMTNEELDALAGPDDVPITYEGDQEAGSTTFEGTADLTGIPDDAFDLIDTSIDPAILNPLLEAAINMPDGEAVGLTDDDLGLPSEPVDLSDFAVELPEIDSDAIDAAVREALGLPEDEVEKTGGIVPVYYDMFGDPHLTQAEANAVDDAIADLGTLPTSLQDETVQAIINDVTQNALSNIGTDTQQPASTTTASQDYLSAMKKLDDPNSMTEAEQRALYGARGQVPNAAETAYLQRLLGDAKHKEDSKEVIDANGNVVAKAGELYKAGDYVTEQSLGDMFEDLLISGLDIFVNPLSILGDKFTLEGQQDQFIQEQLDAYRDGGTFVYGEDGKTVVGVAQPNYDADGDGVNDTVVLNNANNDFSSGDDKIIVGGGGISVSDVNINNDVDGDNEDDDIDIVFSDITYENTEDGVVETRVGGPDTQTGGDDPCPDGYSLVDGMCQPDDGVGTPEGDEEAARVTLSLRKISRGGGDVTTPTPTPVESDPLTIRAPKQFAMGGPVDLDPNTYDFRGFDADNPFDLSSILAMQKHDIGLKPFDDSQMQLYDLNRDGVVDQTDISAGSRYINYSPDNVFDEQRANAEDFYLYSPQISLGSRPQRDSSTTNPVQQPVQQPVQGMAIRQPKQFAAGGMVTPNIDRFLQSLGA